MHNKYYKIIKSKSRYSNFDINLTEMEFDFEENIIQIKSMY